LVRPLLPFFREEIEAYCREEGLQPRRDESNDSLAYTRNRLRHRLIPQLAEFNPRVKEAILKLSLLAAEEEKDGLLHPGVEGGHPEIEPACGGGREGLGAPGGGSRGKGDGPAGGRGDFPGRFGLQASTPCFTKEID